MNNKYLSYGFQELYQELCRIINLSWNTFNKINVKKKRKKKECYYIIPCVVKHCQLVEITLRVTTPRF